MSDAENAPITETEPAAAPTADPAPMSPDWFRQMVAINEANFRQAQANAALKAKELREAEDAVQRIAGALDALKALHALATPPKP